MPYSSPSEISRHRPHHIITATLRPQYRHPPTTIPPPSAPQHRHRLNHNTATVCTIIPSPFAPQYRHRLHHNTVTLRTPSPSPSAKAEGPFFIILLLIFIIALFVCSPTRLMRLAVIPECKVSLLICCIVLI